MTRPPYELLPTPNGVLARIHARGSAVLASPTINRGTAFTLGEREQLGLTGLLPTGVTTPEGPTRRVWAQYQQQPIGTDWTVAPLNPMLTLYAAVTRATLDGKNPNGWLPEQKLKVAEAVEAYTMGSAYAEFQDKVKGSISVGKLADMVILSDDLFTIDPKNIRDVNVDTTIVGGNIVWNRP